MDDSGATLVGQFGHCNQELLNLLLSGSATSNVFDGTVPMGNTGLTLRGIPKRSAVGYLTHLEALRYCQVSELFFFFFFLFPPPAMFFFLSLGDSLLLYKTALAAPDLLHSSLSLLSSVLTHPLAGAASFFPHITDSMRR